MLENAPARTIILKKIYTAKLQQKVLQFTIIYFVFILFFITTESSCPFNTLSSKFLQTSQYYEMRRNFLAKGNENLVLSNLTNYM